MIPTAPRPRQSYPEASRGPMALPIVLLRDKNQDLSHEQCLLASFGHMAKLMDQSLSGDWTEDWQTPWDQWKTGKFRKIVKRANPHRFSMLVEDPQSIHSAIQVGDELVELLSFPAYELTDPDPRMKPLQVAGLDYESRGSFPTPGSEGGLVLAYSGELGASTGKMMAQAAHGAQLLKLREPGWHFSDEPVQVVDGFEQEDVDWLVEVVDAGFTEIAPNSLTVKVGRLIR